MAAPQPGLAEIQDAIVALLREEEVGTLATVDADGSPSASDMHIAGDGVRVYVHTFTYNRKYAEMLADPRVSYAISYTPPAGFDDRFETRSLQVKGRATLVTTPEEIQRAVTVSREQFPWLARTAMYDNVKMPDQGQQVFFRIDPVSAVWADHRVRLLWRVFLEFDASGSQVTGERPYDAVVGRRG
jgi:nitroimidazol reductase NimA-like FMN-containing flavoprotein (pyridoxamine 5'-phosphate oxidase superfamily)